MPSFEAAAGKCETCGMKLPPSVVASALGIPGRSRSGLGAKVFAVIGAMLFMLAGLWFFSTALGDERSIPEVRGRGRAIQTIFGKRGGQVVVGLVFLGAA
jgi:hypothetical protein